MPRSFGTGKWAFARNLPFATFIPLERKFAMLSHSPEIQNLDDLRQYVYSTICQQNELEPGAFQMSQKILLRGGKPCGIYFCVHGPRSVKLTAIWETDRNTVLFYGSSGQRQFKAQLAETPAMACALA